jgi:hypothetical protein
MWRCLTWTVLLYAGTAGVVLVNCLVSAAGKQTAHRYVLVLSALHQHNRLELASFFYGNSQHRRRMLWQRNCFTCTT